LRWTCQGIGKSSGARVIYFKRLASGEVVLLLVYAKAKFDNLQPATCNLQPATCNLHFY